MRRKEGGEREGANILVKNAHSTHSPELEKNRLRGTESGRGKKKKEKITDLSKEGKKKPRCQLGGCEVELTRRGREAKGNQATSNLCVERVSRGRPVKTGSAQGGSEGGVGFTMMGNDGSGLEPRRRFNDLIRRAAVSLGSRGWGWGAPRMDTISLGTLCRTGE